MSFKLCREGLSDDISERSLSHGSRRGANPILAKNEVFFRDKITLKKEPLANACVNWLLVLYYGGSSLNGVWCSSEIETSVTADIGCRCLLSLNGVWCSSEIETEHATRFSHGSVARLNGVWCSSEIETIRHAAIASSVHSTSKWSVVLVGD